MRRILLAVMACLTVNSWAQSLTKNLATVTYLKTEVISEQDYIKTLKAMEAQMGEKLSNDDRKKLLDSMVDSILLLQAATKEKVTITNDELLGGLRSMFQMPTATLAEIEKAYKDSPAAVNASWSSFLDEVKKQGAKEKYLSTKIIPPTPNDAEIQKAYDENKDNFIMPRSARVSHIFVSFKDLNAEQKKAAYARIQETYKKLQSGGYSFEQLVRTDSQDGASSQRLGDIGYILDNPNYRAELGDEFVNAVFSLKPGRTSGVVSSKEGYHILKMTEEDSQRLLKLSDVNPGNPNQTIKQMVSMQLQAKTFRDESLKLIANLRKQSKIEINEGNWAPWARGEKAAS